MNLPEGLTRKHIEDAVNRGDHVMMYRGGVVNIDELWKMIQEDEKPKGIIENDQRGKLKRIREQSENGSEFHT